MFHLAKTTQTLPPSRLIIRFLLHTEQSRYLNLYTTTIRTKFWLSVHNNTWAINKITVMDRLSPRGCKLLLFLEPWRHSKRSSSLLKSKQWKFWLSVHNNKWAIKEPIMDKLPKGDKNQNFTCQSMLQSKISQTYGHFRKQVPASYQHCC